MDFNYKKSNRLTNQWTDTTELAYGLSGKMGRDGEQWLANKLQQRGYEVVDHENSYEQQLQGIDLSIHGKDLTRWYTIDVKNNIKDDGTFFIETSKGGWLRHPKKISDCIWHVNTKTSQTARYSRKKMIEFVTNSLKDKNFIKNLKPGMLFVININSIPENLSFIKVEL